MMIMIYILASQIWNHRID